MYRVRNIALVCIFLVGIFFPLSAADTDMDFDRTDFGRNESALDALPHAGLRDNAAVLRPVVPEPAQREDALSPDLIDRIIEINTRFSLVSIALAAVTALLVLLLLFRLSSIRDALSRSARDMANTKEALRYLMDMDKQAAARAAAEPAAPSGRKERGASQAEMSAAPNATDTALAHITGEMEKFAKRLDELSLPAVKAGAKSSNSNNEEEVRREVERRLADMHIETVEPAVGEKFDPLLHDEVDSRPSRDELDGTIFRVVQTGLVYNNRVALKARVVVNRG